MTVRPRRHLAAFIILLSAAAVLWPDAQASATPEQASKFISDLTGEVISVISADSPLAAREDRLQRILRRGLDLGFMSHFVVGRYWQSATPRQQAQYETVFSDFVVRSYARRLADQMASGFKIVSARQTVNGDVVVEETVERPNGPPVNYGFRVRNSDRAPKVIDVAVEGASLLLAQRSDFMLVVQKQGIDALIEALRQKIAQN